MKNAIHKYLVYVTYFLGIGMTSSGIVLMPFNAIRYSIILIIGLSLFLTSSIFNEIVVEKHQLTISQSIRLSVLSLGLALGIGMISGGIAHFKESPLYVAYLIPFGILISFISFMLKNHEKVFVEFRLKMLSVITILAICLFGALYFSAQAEIQVTPKGGDVFKSSSHSMEGM